MSTYTTNQPSGGPNLLTIIILIAIGWLIWQNLDIDLGDDNGDDDTPVDAEGVWEAVATLVEEGDPEDTHELAALIIQLKESNIIDEDQVEAFNDEFPDLLEEHRELTDEDAEKIRSLE